MKTSFARTFDITSKNDTTIVPCDRIYPDRNTICEIDVDGTRISSEAILVVNIEDNDFDASGKISSFIASKELKKQYDEIYFELDTKRSEFIKKLKVISQSTDCESEFINTFSLDDNKSFFELLNSIITELSDKPDKYSFRYNDVFDKKGNIKKFLEKNQTLLDQYIKNYHSLLSKSSFFKESENSFGTYQANEILKSIEDNSFFEAGHKFILEGNIDVDSSKKLKDIVQGEIDKIINDEKLKKSFDKVDKSIGANLELRAFKKVIERDNLLLVELTNYESFKKKVWLNYFSELKGDATVLSKFYDSKKNELEKILKEAKKEFKIWRDIINKFNSRFYVPFEVVLINQEDIILKQETASLVFEYNDRNELPIRQNKENLLNILSKGEQRAYYILQFLFEIESRKLNTQKNLIIFDDVADSFDYKNKYAIIEYIKELHESGIFRIIILTHNFDFYRTVSSRLFLPRASVFMALKNDNSDINLLQGQYRKDVFAYFLKQKNNPKIFISLIPFVRNLVEYSEDDTCGDYIMLTNCLHLKSETHTIQAKDIQGIYNSRFTKTIGKITTFEEIKILDLIYETADTISSEPDINEILLENKIVLSIAIRLKSEEFMIRSLPDFDLSSITSNQTRELFNEYSKIYDGDEQIKYLDKVNLMTPENIHINAFMYEPLIDMSVNHLISLYGEINTLQLQETI